MITDETMNRLIKAIVEVLEDQKRRVKMYGGAAVPMSGSVEKELREAMTEVMEK